VHIVNSDTFISLFLTTVIQLLLVAKHRIGVIVMFHMPIYRQTLHHHQMISQISGNFSLILNLRKIYNRRYEVNATKVVSLIIRR